MHVRQSLSWVFALASLSAAPVNAAVTWGVNGHSYAAVFVANPTWSSARATASGMTFNGVSGHLATFTSRAEQEFVIGALGGGAALNAMWLGGYQTSSGNEPYGNWRWVTGEAWQGVAPNDTLIPRSDFGFNNTYFDGSPESVTITWWNSGGINDYVDSPNPAFGDGSGGPARGFIVEFGGVPEPDQWGLMLSGFGLLGVALRRRAASRRCLQSAQFQGETAPHGWLEHAAHRDRSDC